MFYKDGGNCLKKPLKVESSCLWGMGLEVGEAGDSTCHFKLFYSTIGVFYSFVFY